MYRSRQVLSNQYLIAEIGLDTAAKGPFEVWGENGCEDEFVIEMLNQREYRINTQFIKQDPSVEESPETRNDSAA